MPIPLRGQGRGDTKKNRPRGSISPSNPPSNQGIGTYAEVIIPAPPVPQASLNSFKKFSIFSLFHVSQMSGWIYSFFQIVISPPDSVSQRERT